MPDNMENGAKKSFNGVMLTVMNYINNHFVSRWEAGDFFLSGNQIALRNKYKIGQYILVAGADLVSGLYQITDLQLPDGGASGPFYRYADDDVFYIYTLDVPEDQLYAVDEEFSGTVYGLRVDPVFLALVRDIYDFMLSPSGAPGNIVSESVLGGKHSYSLATNASDGLPAGWQDIYKARLRPFWRVDKDLSL